MTPKLFDRWIAALKSGKYKQTVNVLRDENGFCCLGVLADKLCPEGWEAGATGTPFRHSFEGGLRIGILRDIPPEVCSLSPSVQAHLSRLNDGTYGYRKYAFPEIANFLQKHREMFFAEHFPHIDFLRAMEELRKNQESEENKDE